MVLHRAAGTGSRLAAGPSVSVASRQSGNESPHAEACMYLGSRVAKPCQAPEVAMKEMEEIL
jgi:hypothetical protein